MRFAITATDRYQGVFEAFIEAGWQPVKLFTAPLNNRTEFNQSVLARAQALAIDVQLSPMQEHDLQDLAMRGCDLLVVASYNWRIGNWRPYLRHAINFHPSPLPEGRGPYPAVRAILEQRHQWGVSCHQLDAAFDSGPILAQEVFPLAADECHDSLDLKVQMASRRLAQRVAADLPALWAQARPQQGGSYWPRWSEEERLIDFRQPVASIARHVRAFRCVEALAEVNGVLIYVRRVVVWTESHAHVPGAMVHRCNHSLVLAARDGYVGLVEWSVIAPDAVSNLGR
jgi:methionyl-tRNA formyltransferase